MHMPAKFIGARARGPYEDKRRPGRWRVAEFAADGKRTGSKSFDDRKKAEHYIRFLNESLVAKELTTTQALDEHLDWMRSEGGASEGHIDTTRTRILGFFQTALPLWALRAKRCQELYDRLVREPTAATGKPPSVATHRGTLSQVKTFLNWCVERGYISANPAADVKGVGTRNKRKKQLHVRDLRKWYAVAVEWGSTGDDGAIAALVALLMGRRASEITRRVVGDVDSIEAPFDAMLVTGAKTSAGDGWFEIPEVLRPMVENLAAGRGPDEPLFHAPRARDGFHHKDWVRKQVWRICDAAGVDRVTAHGMRGALATVSLKRGADIAGYLGHADVRTTENSYAAPGARQEGERRRGLRLIAGGRE